MRPKRILIVAEVREGWTFSSCARALEELGHRISVFNLGDVTFAVNRSFLRRAQFKISKQPVAARINKKLLEQVGSQGLDLILVCKGEYLFPETLGILKARTGALLFNWHTDDYFSRTLSSQWAIDAIRLYDCIFVHAKESLLQLRRAGARRTEYLPHGADPALLKMLKPDQPPDYDRDVLFLGNWRKERQGILEEMIHLEPPAWRFTIAGHEWDHVGWCSPLRRYLQPAVEWNAYGPMIRKSKINVVFLVHFDTGRCVVPLRLFEIPLAGGFMLVERGSGQAEEFYSVGKEIAFFQDAAELLVKIRQFLKDGSRRYQIAMAGQQRAIASEYLTPAKMKRVLAVLNELSSS